MNYSEYYRNLNIIEIRLFQEGYFKFNEDSLTISTTDKWKRMINYLCNQNTHEGDDIGITRITEVEIYECLDNPELFSDYNHIYVGSSYTKKDGSISRYKYRQKNDK